MYHIAQAVSRHSTFHHSRSLTTLRKVYIIKGETDYHGLLSIQESQQKLNHTPNQQKSIYNRHTADQELSNMTCLCQICGRRFYDDDDTSNPLAHFCIGLDGPAIVREEAGLSAPHTPELERSRIVAEATCISTKLPTLSSATQLPAPAHAKEDLAEIARLRLENEKLKSRLHKNHVTFAQ